MLNKREKACLVFGARGAKLIFARLLCCMPLGWRMVRIKKPECGSGQHCAQVQTRRLAKRSSGGIGNWQGICSVASAHSQSGVPCR